MALHGLKYMRVEESAPGVLTVSYARPERRNAVHDAMLDEMLAVVDEIRTGYPTRYRAVVMRGEGEGFSAGGDLEAFRAMLGQPRHVIESYIARFHQFALAWYDLPMPTIAAIHGAAAGGGAVMGLLCDLRYASIGAQLHFSFIKIGLNPDMGSHYLLPALVGSGRALELLLSGEPVSAEEAHRLGLVAKVLPDRQALDEAAVAVATAIAQAPPEVTRTIKRLVRQAPRSSLAETIAAEVSHQTERFLDPAFADRIGKFFAKS